MVRVLLLAVKMASVSFDAGAKYWLYANSGNARGANDHILARVDFGYGYVDKFFGGGFGHELVAVPLLEVLNSCKADFFFVATIEGDMDNVFARSSWHFGFAQVLSLDDQN